MESNVDEVHERVTPKPSDASALGPAARPPASAAQNPAGFLRHQPPPYVSLIPRLCLCLRHPIHHASTTRLLQWPSSECPLAFDVLAMFAILKKGITGSAQYAQNLQRRDVRLSFCKLCCDCGSCKTARRSVSCKMCIFSNVP